MAEVFSLRVALDVLRDEHRAIRSLRSANLLAAAVHTALIFALLQVDFIYNVTVLNFINNPINPTELIVEPLLSVKIVYLVVAYLALAAVAHILTATVLWERYTTYLKQHRNPLRWIEYSLSCSVMLVALALSAGIVNAYVLVAIFFASMAMNFSGLVFENVNRHTGRVVWSPFILGSLLGIMPWAIMLHQLHYGDDFRTLDFATVIHYYTLGIFMLFPAVMWLSAKRLGPWKSYVTTETSYMFLSIFAKTSLAVLLYFNLF